MYHEKYKVLLVDLDKNVFDHAITMIEMYFE